MFLDIVHKPCEIFTVNVFNVCSYELNKILVFILKLIDLSMFADAW